VQELSKKAWKGGKRNTGSELSRVSGGPRTSNCQKSSKRNMGGTVDQKTIRMHQRKENKGRVTNEEGRGHGRGLLGPMGT